ncbi:MAG: monovalent cation/H(+) antiporter subunit G [Bacillota bacterium]
MTYVAAALMLAGFFLLLVGTIGVLRLPDFFTRLHAVGKCDTLGMLLFIAGLMVYEGLSLIALKLAFIWVFLAIANPTATHIFSRAAYRAGLKPWTRGKEEAG